MHPGKSKAQCILGNQRVHLLGLGTGHFPPLKANLVLRKREAKTILRAERQRAQGWTWLAKEHRDSAPKAASAGYSTWPQQRTNDFVVGFGSVPAVVALCGDRRSCRSHGGHAHRGAFPNKPELSLLSSHGISCGPPCRWQLGHGIARSEASLQRIDRRSPSSGRAVGPPSDVFRLIPAAGGKGRKSSRGRVKRENCFSVKNK